MKYEHEADRFWEQKLIEAQERHDKEQAEKIENRRKNSWRNDYSEGHCADILKECGLGKY